MKKIIGVVILAFTFNTHLNAATVTTTGTLSDANAIQLFDMFFPTGTTGSITAQTVDFDPVLSLFAADGTTLLVQNDDGGPGFDALIAGSLPIGNYILALTQFNFFPTSIFDTHSGNSAGNLNWELTFNGSDDAIITARPSEVPLPAAVWLFGSGLLGFAGLRRKSI